MPFDGTNHPPVVMALIEGRQKIEKGWCKHELRSDKGEVCAIGAIVMSDHSKEAFDLLHDALPEKWQRCCGVDMYNNASSTTKVDILDLFDRAIALGKGG